MAAAIRTHPWWLGGTGRTVTRLIETVPGLIAKDGAEGVFAAALPDGRALAVKIVDGSARPVPVVVVAALRALGTDAARPGRPGPGRGARPRRTGRRGRHHGIPSPIAQSPGAAVEADTRCGLIAPPRAANTASGADYRWLSAGAPARSRPAGSRAEVFNGFDQSRGGRLPVRDAGRADRRRFLRFRPWPARGGRRRRARHDALARRGARSTPLATDAHVPCSASPRSARAATAIRQVGELYAMYLRSGRLGPGVGRTPARRGDGPAADLRLRAGQPAGCWPATNARCVSTGRQGWTRGRAVEAGHRPGRGRAGPPGDEPRLVPGLAVFQGARLERHQRAGWPRRPLAAQRPAPSSSSSPLVEVAQRAAVADADHDGLRQLGAEQLVEHVLEALVHRRGGLVQEHHLRAADQDPGEAEPLLLAGGEPARPVDRRRRGGRPGAPAAPCAASRGPGRRRSHPALRVGQRGAQAAQRHVGLLGQEQRAARPAAGAPCRRRTATGRPGCAAAWSCRSRTGP